MPNSILKTMILIMFGFALVASDANGQDGRMMYANLAKGKNIAGKIVGLEKLDVQTNFGSVQIPIGKIAGIRLHADKDDSAVIAFENGDVITGKINLKEFQIKTDWGKAYVKSEFVESLMTDKNSQFYNDQNGGWRFTRVTTAPQITSPQIGR